MQPNRITRQLLTFILLLPLTAAAQLSTPATYRFLDLTNTPYTAALGGNLASTDKPDIALFLANPALADSSLHNHASLSYTDYFAGIRYVTAIYARRVHTGIAAVGIKQVSYGSFVEADNTGTINGTFRASDMAITAGYSYPIDSCWQVGADIKIIYSHLERYRSYGIGTDIGIRYLSHSKLFSAGLIARNIGTMLRPYTPDNYEPLPFELVAGFSKKLAHAPFRFVLTFQQLQELDSYYTVKDDSEPLGTNTQPESTPLTRRIGREIINHVVIGLEFTPVKSFTLRFGYNYRRRNELKVKERVSTVGFSWGIRISISKFTISYSRSTYHLAGATNSFGITTGLDRFLRK